MIWGIGIDVVTIARIAAWQRFSPERLDRILSQAELGPSPTPQRLATRFAAKESLYKALCAGMHTSTSATFSLFTLCRYAHVRSTLSGAPYFEINWQALASYLPALLALSPTVHLSLSHEEAYAVASVVIECDK